MMKNWGMKLAFAPKLGKQKFGSQVYKSMWQKCPNGRPLLPTFIIFNNEMYLAISTSNNN